MLATFYAPMSYFFGYTEALQNGKANGSSVIEDDFVLLNNVNQKEIKNVFETQANKFELDTRSTQGNHQPLHGIPF